MLLAFCNNHGNQLDCNELQFKKKSMYIKKQGWNPSTQNTTQIITPKHMPCKNITIETSLLH